MLSRAALLSIELYQKHVSPYKGFACARRVHTGRSSCSQFASRTIRRHGLIRTLLLVPARGRACALSARMLASASASPEDDNQVKNEPCPLWNRIQGRNCLENTFGACACWPF